MNKQAPELQALFGGFVGNADVVEAVKIEVEGARRSGSTLSHILMTGYPGTGKTTLSRLIAQAMDATFLDIDCTALDGKALEEILFQTNLVPVRLTSGKYDLVALPTIVLWDESHRMDKNKHQSALLKPILDKLMTLKDGTRVDVSAITHVFATTDADQMVTPLKDRCEFHVHLDRYSVDELACIVSSFKIDDQEIISGKLTRQWYTVKLTPTVNNLIAERAKHTPRLALNMVRRYYRFLRAHADTPQEAVSLSSPAQLQRFFQVNGIGLKGLRKRDWQYLRLLADAPKPLGASLLASQLEVSEAEVRNEIEPHLRFCRLIEATKAGRQITRAGRLLLEEAIAGESGLAPALNHP